MASGTIYFAASPKTSPSESYIQGKIEWRETEQTTSGVPPLTSKVLFSLYVRKANDTTELKVATTGTWGWSYEIAGTTNSGSTYLSVLGWTKIFEDYPKTITHNATTGAATCYISGSVSAPSGTSLAGKTSSGGQTVALDTLYVITASSISASSYRVAMGDTVSFAISNSTAGLSHRVDYSCGRGEGTIASSVGTSCSWTVPDLLQYTGGSPEDATITCYTYNGSTLIGSNTCTVRIMPYAASTVSVSKLSVDLGGSVSIEVVQGHYTHYIYYHLNSGSDIYLTTISGSGSYEWTVPTSLAENMTGNNDRVTITCSSEYGSTRIGYTTASFGVTVSQATVPTLSPSTVSMGSVMTINLPRAASSFTHQVTYSFVGDTETATGTIASSAGTSCTWTVPYNLATKITSHTSGYGYIKVKTYNGSTQVGSEQQVQFTATVPDNATTKPTLTMTLTKVQPSVLDNEDPVLKGNWIQGVTKVQAAFIATSEYSTIPQLGSAYTLSVGGSITHGNPSTSGEIDASGTIDVYGYVTDARGYTGGTTDSITVYPYSPPRVIPYTGYTDIVCERCTQAGTPASDGTYLLVKAARTFSPLTISSVSYNSCVFEYRYKEASASWQDDEFGWVTLASDASFSGVVPNVNLNISKEYTIQIRAKDTITNKHIITVTIPSEATPLHLAEGGTGMGIGRLCDSTGLHIGWPTTFHTGIVRNAVFEADSLHPCWYEGHYVSADQSADDSKIDEYSMFLVVVTDTSGGTTKKYTVLCTRQGDEICGSLDISTSAGIQTISIYMTYIRPYAQYGLYLNSAKSMIHNASGSHGALTTLNTSNLYITALYALL